MSLAAVEFVIQTPVVDDIILSNIAHSAALGLQMADRAPIAELMIVANGPSASLAPLHADVATLAVNGSLKLFTDQGLAPTYWACCDPQEHVADFIPDNPPESTIYLVATKCHPRVFEKLKNRKVETWHINDYPSPFGHRSVRCASTVTLTIQTLMRYRGYRKFDVYGWDACYAVLDSGEIQHHASDKPLPDYPEGTLDLCVGAQEVDGEMVGGRWFKTTRTWAAEAQDAVIQLHHADYETRVHGDGLIKAMTGR